MTFVHLTVLSALLSTMGCGNKTLVSADGAELAQEALIAALDAWKSGSAPDELRQHNPEIIVGDLDWKAKQKLVDYHVSDAGSFDGKQLRIPVTLIVQPSAGSRQRRVETKYIIGIDPVITVIRESE
jgi:hypothetical protein